jgi:predicted permease
MTRLRILLSRLVSIFQKRRLESELEDEIRSHLEMETEANLRRGMGATEARQAALRSFGGQDQMKEQYRDLRGLLVLETIFQDVRYSLRRLRSSPAFTIIAVLTLALGIGANTAIYSAIDGVLLHPTPFPEADRLVALYQQTPNTDKSAVSYLNLLDWKQRTETFESIAGWRTDLFTLTGRGQPEQLAGMMVSADFFSVLRVQPLRGRTFHPEEDRRGTRGVALLGEEFWIRRFGSDPNVVGQSLTLNGRDVMVIGIVPATVRLQRFNNSYINDVFIPIGQHDSPIFHERGVGDGTLGLGRLKSGVTLEQARAEMDSIMKGLVAEYPNENALTGVTLISFEQYVVGDLQTVLLALGVAVGFVLLIACTNVANLALARSTGRSQEFAIRVALGAARRRLIRQVLTESALLALTGGALGVFIAFWGTRAALDVLPSALPAISSVEVNGRVLLFSLAVSLLTGVAFGLLPALKAAALDPQTTLKQARRGAIRGRHRSQRIFIMSELALTLMLLVGGGLMIRSLQTLWSVSPGFDPEDVLVFYTGVSPEKASTPEAIRAAMRDMSDRLAAVPGVTAASIQVGGLPFLGNTTLGFQSENDPEARSTREMRTANFYAVSENHFTAMGVPLLRGRSFTPQDSANSSVVVIVDEELARAVFPGEDPIGKHLRIGLFGPGRPAEIIGIAGHVKHSGLDADATARVRSQFYAPIMQLPDAFLPLAANATAGIVRFQGESANVITAIRNELGVFDERRAVHSEQLMTDIVAGSLARRRFSLFILCAFAATALVLSIIGVYGVVSYFVGQRTNEIGVRIALGAQPRDIFFDVLSDGAKLGVVGVTVGLAGSAALTRLMASLLFGISPLDLVTFTSATALLLGLTLLACYIPARRAIQIDPMSALRCE